MTVHNLFVSHTWTASDSFEKLSGLLHMSSGPLADFRYQFYSVSKDDPIQNLPSKKHLRAAVEEKMKSCSCVLILGGLYETHKKWIDIEIDTAKKLKKRVIIIQAWKEKKLTETEKKAAHEVVKWHDETVINAILQAQA